MLWENEIGVSKNTAFRVPTMKAYAMRPCNLKSRQLSAGFISRYLNLLHTLRDTESDISNREENLDDGYDLDEDSYHVPT